MSNEKTARHETKNQKNAPRRGIKKETKAKLRAFLMVGIMVVVALVAAASCFI